MSHKPMRVIARVPNVACPNAAHAGSNRFMKVGSIHEAVEDFPYVVSLLKSGEVWPADAQTAERASDARVIARWLAVKPHVDKIAAAQKADEEKAAAEAKRAEAEAKAAAEKATESAKKALEDEAAELAKAMQPTPADPAPKPEAPKTPAPSAKAGE